MPRVAASSYLQGKPPWGSASSGAWASLVVLGVSSMYLGFFAWYRGLALAGIARGGQVQQVQPLLTLLWSALLLGERITASTVVAAVAVIVAVLWSQRGRAGLEEAHERDAREDQPHPDKAPGADVLRLESHPAELVDDE